MDTDKDMCLQSVGELTSQQFRQLLNEWFERHGVVDNLRSHLRRLMITALQQTEMCLKPQQKTSPKAQSVNLLVAEHLLKQGCHYTLSVLMSELPALANFGDASARFRTRDGEKRKKKYHFQDHEVMEILNSLGMPSYDQGVSHVCDVYREKREEESLLECLLVMTAQAEIRQNSKRCSAKSRDGLSKEWSAQVSELLTKTKDNSLQLVPALEMLSKLTWNEMKRNAGEESKWLMADLAERERRIQAHLKNHENEILQRLQTAEKELDARRETIDKELTERQTHLRRIAFQWQDKHNQIMALSKEFAAVKNENNTLLGRLADMEKETAELRLEIQRKTDAIERLEAERTSFKCHVQEYLKWKDKRRTDAVTSNVQVESATEDDTAESDPCKEDVPLSEAEEILLDKVKFRLRVLEDEDGRLSERYMKYKKRYDGNDSSDPEEVKVTAQEEFPEVEELEEVFVPLPAEAPKKKEKEVDSVGEEVVLKESPKGENPPMKRREMVEERPPTVAPTLRQQKNREYYLQSRNLLEILEKGADVMDAYASGSTTEPSWCTSDETPAGKEPDEGVEAKESPRKTEGGETGHVTLDDAQCLTLLKEATHRDIAASQLETLEGTGRAALTLGSAKVRMVRT